MIQKVPIYVLILAALMGCKDGHVATLSSDKFPPVALLDTIKSAVFVQTLEHNLPEEKNVVYSPAFLYAWDELRKSGNGQVTVPDDNADLQYINKSISHRGALSGNEYTTKVELNGGTLRINASFARTMPFKEPLDTSAGGLTFLGTVVKAFGMPRYAHKVAEQIGILYYENDDRFIFHIVPEKEGDEIIFAKGFNEGRNFSEILQTVQHFTNRGKQERNKEGNNWKYSLRYGDDLLIPVMKFNYLANYKSIVGQKIFSGQYQWNIEVATQENAFVLNEHGAKVESNAKMEMKKSVAELDEVKKLELNKEFILIMKRQVARHPYFMMVVRNAGFMQPQTLNPYH